MNIQSFIVLIHIIAHSTKIFLNQFKKIRNSGHFLDLKNKPKFQI